MAKQPLLFVALLVFQGVALSLAAPKSGSTAFDEWLATFDPSTALASKIISCTGKPNGYYPFDEPETCSAKYTACVSGNAYEQTCASGNVFDSTPGVSKCVDRDAAASVACEPTYTVGCTADNVGVFQPTDKCSDWYYICLSPTGQPQFQQCPTDQYFNPVKKVCESTVGAPACSVPPPTVEPPKVPDYTCSGKETNNEAYATSKCSVSFYTCTSTSLPPTPGSCNAVPGAPAGSVFDYTINPAAPATAASCKPKIDVPDCPKSLIASA